MQVHRTTYVAGQDQSRLAQVAKDFGLEEPRRPKDRFIGDDKGNQGGQGRMPMPSWVKASMRSMKSMMTDDTMTAARMHSVGVMGFDEAMNYDESGAFHLVTIRRRRTTLGVHRQEKSTPSLFGSNNMFAPPKRPGRSLRDMGTVEEEQEEELEDEIEEDDDEEEEEVATGGSLQAAVFGIIKATVGPAILFLPRGFVVSGYAVAVPAMIFATALFIYNSYRLLDCWEAESQRNERIVETRALLLGGGKMDETDNTEGGSNGTKRYDGGASNTLSTAQPKLLTYPELARRGLGRFAFLVDFGIASLQFGVTLTCLIFVPQNLHEFTKTTTGINLPSIFFVLLMLLIVTPLTWIRDIRKFTPTNVLATILTAYGLAAVLGVAFVAGFQPSENGESIAFVQNLKTLPAFTSSWFIFIGTSFYMMEGAITLLVPLQQAIQRKEDRAKFPKVNERVTIGIVTFYMIFCMISIAAFGMSIETALTASLTGFVANTTQLAYSINVILTFPLQAFPALEVACQAVGIGQKAEDNFRRNVFATLVTFTLGAIAVVAYDYLDIVVSLLGSLFGVPLALMFPPIMHNNLVPNSSPTRKFMNKLVVCFGFVAMAFTSISTIASINS